MLQTKSLFTSLFGVPPEKPTKKSQDPRMQLTVKGIQQKTSKIFDNIEKKPPKPKVDENAVAKLLKNVKAAHAKHVEELEKAEPLDCRQKGPKFHPFKPQRAPIITEPVEIETLPQIDIELLYDREYGDHMEKHLFSNLPDFSYSLKNTSITEKMRSMMIDWMIEVLSNYNQSTSHQTFFLAVAIMDMYFKHSKKPLQNSDVHLSGLCAMFLASKVDDIYYIPLKEFITSVGHKKFSAEEIKQREWEIVSTLNFNVYIPTHLDYLGRIIQKNFQNDDTKNIHSIRLTSINLLKMCLHDYDMLRFSPRILAYAALCYSVKFLFNDILENCKEKNETLKIQQDEAALLKSIINSSVIGEIDEVQKCLEAIKDLMLNFKKKYPNLKNLEKFSESIMS